MFRGSRVHSIDDKGRTSVPKNFYQTLISQDEARLVITCHYYPCLVVYPLSRWKLLEEKISQLSDHDPSIIRFKRLYIGGAHECQIDGQGRILIPKQLRDYAELNREIMWIGQINYMEIWSKQKWDQLLREDIIPPDESERMKFSLRLKELGL
jgi:MraZ protein